MRNAQCQCVSLSHLCLASSEKDTGLFAQAFSFPAISALPSHRLGSVKTIMTGLWDCRV